MVVADAMVRKLPGALGHADSRVEESFSQALEGAPNIPTTPAQPRTGGGRSPRCCCPAITPACGEWRLEQSRGAGGTGRTG